MPSNTSGSPSRRSVLLAAAVSVVLSGGARADAAEDKPVTVSLGEITVTSQKLASGVSNQDVPAAITAFDAAAIEGAFAVNLTDLGRLAPNVQLNQVSTFNGYSNFYIRGIGINGSTRTVDPAVGLFVDGIYIGFGPSSLIDTFDLESVEVLRGPQGTLFGRNVTGGAIVATTKRPVADLWSADVKLVAGNYDRTDLAASVNMPLGGAGAFRLAAIYQQQDGYFKNLENGRTKADKDLVLVRPSLKFWLSDDLDVTIIGEYSRNEGGPATSQNIVNPQFPKLAQTLFGYVPPADKYDIRHDLQGYSNSRTRQLVVEANWDVGHGLVTGIAGYREVDFDSSTDFDGSPITLFHFPDNRESQEQSSVELRYASDFSDTVRFTAGVYWYDSSFFVGEQRDTFGGALGTVRTIGRTDQDQTQYAAFAQGSWSFADRWDLVAGARYTKEDKDIRFTPPGVARCQPDFSACTLTLPGEDSWDNFSPKLGLDYRPADGQLAYVSWTRGSRSGVYNSRAQRVEFLGPSEPETVDSYELGYKAEFLDRRLRLNAAVFYMTYDDIQKIVNDVFDPDGPGPQPPTSGQTVKNAAQATIKGGELELTALVGERLKLDASIGYTDASYDEFNGQDVTGDGVPDPALAKRLKFEKVPEMTAYAGATYRVPLGAEDVLAFRASYSYTDKFYTDTLNRYWLAQDAFGLLDASVTFARGDRWQLSLWGKNLTDEEFIDFAADVGTLGSWVFGGEPRRYGVEFKLSL